MKVPENHKISIHEISQQISSYSAGAISGTPVDFMLEYCVIYMDKMDMITSTKDQFHQLERKESAILSEIGYYEMLPTNERMQQSCPYDEAVEVYRLLAEYYEKLANNHSGDNHIILRYKSWAAHYSGESEKFQAKLNADLRVRSSLSQ